MEPVLFWLARKWRAGERLSLSCGLKATCPPRLSTGTRSTVDGTILKGYESFKGRSLAGYDGRVLKLVPLPVYLLPDCGLCNTINVLAASGFCHLAFRPHPDQLYFFLPCEPK